MTPDEQIGNDITDIKVSIGKIESYMQNSKDALKQVWDNKDDIANLKTKQGFVMKIGGFTLLAIIGFFTRGYWMKH